MTIQNDDEPPDSLVVPDAASDVATPDAASGWPAETSEETSDETSDESTTASSEEEAAPETSSGIPIRPRPRIKTRPTTRLDSKDIKPSWPLAIATLEQIADWPVYALRLGTLALIQACVRELAQSEASADLVVRLRVLVEALAHMPLEA